MENAAVTTDPVLTLRGPVPEDIPFIYQSWLTSYRYGSAMGKAHRNSIFFPEYRLVIDHLLARSSVLVAFPLGHESTILGYLVHEGPALHYVYVKEAFRGFRIARTLFNASGINLELCRFSHRTFEAIPILERYPKLIHDQTLLMKKGDPHGQE